MKKRNFATFGLVALAGIALVASCTDDKVEEKKGLDIYLNYAGTSGITYRKSSSFFNDVEQRNYTEGMLLPTWSAYQEYLGVTLRDASGYTTNKDDDTYNLVSGKDFKSDNGDEYVDLFMNSTANINKMGQAGQAVALNTPENLAKMPNFKKFLQNNPTIEKALQASDGNIYYTPYFDGYNDVERMFVMDTSMVEKILDAASFDNFDTTQNGKDAATNTLQEAAYQPFMDPENNYKEDVTVQVLDGDKVKDVKIKKVTNIIKRQNEKLKVGVTGKALAEQFRQYLDEAFADQIGDGKIYSKRSEIFVGSKAAYNSDDLIALMRVIKANPGVITGDPSKEVVGLFPRGVANNRVANILDFAQIWGVQGFTSEKDMLYFDAKGKLNDGATTTANVQAVKLLSQIYDEGLILKDFYKKPSDSGTYYLDMYFKKIIDNAGYGFIMYDYAAATTASNDMVDNTGTDPSKRKISGEVKGIMPVNPPLTYWANKDSWDHEQDLTNFDGKTLMRHYEENRSLKTGSWCIPTNSDNKDTALKLMDYLFSDEGSKIQDFGPSKYWTMGEVGGEQAPKLTETTLKMLGKSGTDFWSFMREYIGSTHGIGCVRSNALDIQATNHYGQIGLSAMKASVKAGVVNTALVDKVVGKYTWDTTVPTAGYPSLTADTAKAYAAVTAFWTDKASATAEGWVTLVVAKSTDTNYNTMTLGKDANQVDYSLNTVLEQFTVKNQSYLLSYSNYLGANCVPDYAKK